jgi:voltage-gated potassium channel Kch
MPDSASPSADRPQATQHVIIAGFGIPGRFVAELLDYQFISHCVIEQNPAVAQRCRTTAIVTGDARDETVLKNAGIEHATLVAITLPVEAIVHQVIESVRRLRADVRIIARVNFTSAGLIAQKLGADTVVVEEQLAAREFFRLIAATLAGAPVKSLSEIGPAQGGG